jgi:hypothetical protein
VPPDRLLRISPVPTIAGTAHFSHILKKFS